MYKIVETCNFDEDYPNEKFLTHLSFTEDDAKTIAKIFNNQTGAESSRYWKVVDIDYELVCQHNRPNLHN